eukprot:g13836.t1
MRAERCWRICKPTDGVSISEHKRYTEAWKDDFLCGQEVCLQFKKQKKSSGWRVARFDVQLQDTGKKMRGPIKINVVVGGPRARRSHQRITIPQRLKVIRILRNRTRNPLSHCASASESEEPARKKSKIECGFESSKCDDIKLVLSQAIVKCRKVEDEEKVIAKLLRSPQTLPRLQSMPDILIRTRLNRATVFFHILDNLRANYESVSQES